MAKSTKIEGQLEIDHERGVIYFHNKLGQTTLRLSKIDTPIPKFWSTPVKDKPFESHTYFLDYTAQHLPRQAGM